MVNKQGLQKPGFFEKPGFFGYPNLFIHDLRSNSRYCGDGALTQASCVAKISGKNGFLVWLIEQDCSPPFLPGEGGWGERFSLDIHWNQTTRNLIWRCINNASNKRPICTDSNQGNVCRTIPIRIERCKCNKTFVDEPCSPTRT